MDNLAKELLKTVRASRKNFLDMGYCFYLFYLGLYKEWFFNLVQVYRHYLKSTSKEILNNLKNGFMSLKNGIKHLRGNLIGEKKKIVTMILYIKIWKK